MTHPHRSIRVLLAAATACASGALAQDITFTRIIGNGDTMPGGQTFGGAGLPAIDGDYVAMHASAPADDYRAMLAYHIPTRRFTVLADNASISPSWGVPFKVFGNPSILDGLVVYPGAAPLFTSEWDGLYTTRVDEPGVIGILIDEFFPTVTTPSLQAINAHGVAYTEKAVARGPILFTDFFGSVEPVALPGDPSPDGGTYGTIDPPVAGGDLVAFQEFSPYSVYAWNAVTRETRLVIQEGQPVPGQPGRTFETVDVGDTDGRRVLVVGRYGQLSSAYEGIYAWDGVELELLVQRGDPIPGSGGEVFGDIEPVAIDGDLAVFYGVRTGGGPFGLYGVRGGQTFKIVGNDQIVAGDFVIGVIATDTSLSGNRLLFNGSLDRLGRTAYYIAEIDFGDCAADIDGDGELTIFDFLAFQNLFDAGDLAADFDGDGELTIFDFLAFQNEFDAGCG